MDGVETLVKMKRMYPEQVKRAPIICLTASAVSGTKEFMIGSGFTDYLSKPVNIEEMEDALIRYLPAEKVRLTEPDAESEAPSEQLPSALFEIAPLDPTAGLAFCGTR